jgi:Caspase domain/CHAT domain
MSVRCLAISLLMVAFANCSAFAERRMALVIGNGAYLHQPRLANPKNDARLLSQTLQRLGFEVSAGFDLSHVEMRRTMMDFVSNLSPADTALFFFGGHGLQVNGENYLLPVDARIKNINDAKFEGINASSLVGGISGKSRFSFIFLDASRDNAILRQALGKSTRSTSRRGLARIPSQASQGTIVVFSSMPGSVALDGEASNSPFVSALVQHISTPGIEAQVMLRRVRSDVAKRTAGRQMPFSQSSLLQQYYFAGKQPTANSSSPSKFKDALLYSESIKKFQKLRRPEILLELYSKYQLSPSDRAKFGVVMHPLQKQAWRIQKIEEVLARQTTRLRILRKQLSAGLSQGSNVAVLKVRIAELEARLAVEKASFAKAILGQPVRLQRFGNLTAPRRATVGKQFAVKVQLKEARHGFEEFFHKITETETEGTTRVTKDGKLDIELPGKKDEWVIDVDLSPGEFEPSDGETIKKIVVPREGNWTTARFVLNAIPLPDGAAQEERWVSVDLFHKGRKLATLSRPIIVRAIVATSFEPDQSQVKFRKRSMRRMKDSVPTQEQKMVRDRAQAESRPLKGVSNLASVAPAKAMQPYRQKLVLLRASEQSPDVEVSIRYSDKAKLSAGHITIRSPYLNGVDEQFQVSDGMKEWLRNQYSILAKLGVQMRGAVSLSRGKSQSAAPNPKLVISQVKALGRKLYSEYTPPPLRDFIAKLSKIRDIKSIQITSNSPEIPWELVLPDSGKSEFWGIKYRIGRWVPKRARDHLAQPIQSMSFKELHVIAPPYSGSDTLPAQEWEVKQLAQHAGFKRHIASYGAISTLLKRPIPGFVHFSGHGDYKENEPGQPIFGIRLRDQVLEPGAFAELGRGRTTGHPFFFFNACDAGRSISYGGFVQGWGPTVLSGGAGGFIGGQWPLADHAASRFAAAFYAELSKGANKTGIRINDVLIKLRTKFYETGNPTYLAYAFFGHANFRIEKRTLR